MKLVSAVPNLTAIDAATRASLIEVQSYDVELDLTEKSEDPTGRTFRSKTTITFTVRRPGEATFVDLVADTLRTATLNGLDVEVSNYDPAQGIVLENLEAENVLVIDADLQYTNSGKGLHRFVDPLDGQTYLYSQFQTADAKRMYACFDQPDLKATFTIRATVPHHWEVASNGREKYVERGTDSKTIFFETTERISPYITALMAGPYHVVRTHHDGIDLGLWCRKSLSPHLDADQLFQITAQGFDWYHANFGIRYAFGKYDQLFVPEFHTDAMENAACVAFHESFIFKSKVTDDFYARRAYTILHEMAHMWFGNLVTMRWWDDLWLNESFATYAAVLCMEKATRWTDAWVLFVDVAKTWAYDQDQLPTTHPVAADAPDVLTAEVNFDGITYAKGASVLRQLSAYVGIEAFLAGIREYFVEHAYGNTTLSDLLHALEFSSGRNLGQWSKLWLETTGINTLSPEYTLDSDGNYASFELIQAAPADIAISNTLRPHRLALGLYDDLGGTLVRSRRIELDVNSLRTPVAELVGTRPPALLLINDDDMTYCKVRLDKRSLATLREGGIARLPEALQRALCWNAAWDMTRDGEMTARDYVAMVLAGAENETDVGVMQSLTGQALSALELYADPRWAPEGFRALADKSLGALQRAEPGSDHQLAWARALLRSANTSEHISFIRGLLNCTIEVDGLRIDDELRWAIVQTLSALGAIGTEEISTELERDPSAAGQRHAATARALQPTIEAKAEAWQLILDGDLSNALQEAVVAGFAHPTQASLIEPYWKRYFAEISDIWRSRPPELAQGVVAGLFPTWTSTISAEVIAAADKFLESDSLPAPLRRLVVEGQSELIRALHARTNSLQPIAFEH